MYLLSGHKQNSNNDVKAYAEVITEDNYIVVNFKVENYFENTSDEFSKDYRLNEGLWNYDVCEVFLSFEDKTYLELQTSPLNQPFSYLIIKPREHFISPDNLDLTVSNQVISGEWISSIKIHKRDIPGSGELIGNLFVCLGTSSNRLYFALNINKEDSPDFHRPELFRKLL